MDLISLSEYKLALGLTKTEDDAKISSIISRVSALIKKYTNYTFSDNYITPIVENINVKFDETNSIFLSQHTINSITVEELQTDGTYLTLDSALYYVDKPQGIIYKLPKDSYWPTGPGAVRCTYTCGTAEPPEDIKQATIELVKYYLKEEYKESKSIMSSSVSFNNQNNGGGVSKQYNFPSHIQIILDLYRF